MALNAKNYRDEVYRLRAHPTDFIDERDSFVRVYLSLIPFLLGEYALERTFDLPISGLVFPIGFLLFWAFYYSYYRPELLEDKLTVPAEFNPGAILNLLFGVAIWFVKNSVVGSLEWLVTFLGLRPVKKATPPPLRPIQRPRPQQAQTPPPQQAQVPQLPREVVEALLTLGLPMRTNWGEIHHRYRELAKKFHPDLNPEVTNVGSRFMAVDAAFKKLEKHRSQYFQK